MQIGPEFRFIFTPQDLEASRVFYHESLGLPIVAAWNRAPEDRGMVFQAGGGNIEIVAPRAGETAAAPLGIWLSIEVDDVETWYQRAAALGLPMASEILVYPWGHRVLRLTDPDGIPILLFSKFDPTPPTVAAA
jgi:catechol 2,3-dioxygenase-like lactoylglutathione lyase family enzyme